MLLDVTPLNSSFDARNLHLANSKSGRDLVLRSNRGADLSDVVLSEFGLAVRCADLPRAATLGLAICRVVGVRPKKQVIRPDATRGVAGVADYQRSWITAMQAVRSTRRRFVAVSVPKQPVLGFGRTAFPKPTSLRYTDFPHQSESRVCASHSFSGRKNFPSFSRPARM